MCLTYRYVFRPPVKKNPLKRFFCTQSGEEKGVFPSTEIVCIYRAFNIDKTA
jgi:hypothetical protein